jgi:tRNA pseudouridine38-40 synthase
MHYYKATIQYAGTNHFGFQFQKDIPTIQKDINEALYKLIQGKVTTVGASRTDTGVHAVEQFVKITTEEELECKTFLRDFNATLPKEIRCRRLEICEGPYNPIVDSTSKEYRYLFTTTLQSSCNDQLFIANHPYELDLGLMNECAGMILGTHSFHNFCSAGSNVKTTVREILSCEFSLVNPHEVLPQEDLFLLPEELKTCYQLRIVGGGFLKQMVRHLMSGFWLVGRGKITPEEFLILLNGPAKTRRLWKVASPRGLYLYRFN